jgi:hypothetical protein
VDFAGDGYRPLWTTTQSESSPQTIPTEGKERMPARQRARKAEAVRRLGDETWGSKYTRAFKTQKRETGKNWYGLSDLLAEVGYHATPSQLNTLGSLEDAPSAATQRQRAYMALTAMGFDPEDFGLTEGCLIREMVSEEMVSDLRRLTSAGKGVFAA